MFAMRNKDDLKNSKIFGCYHCMKIGKTEEIEEWTDGGETALCPYCKVDSVLPDLTIPISEENLQMINEHWFGNKENFDHKLKK